jgi:anti-sigma regulatory factor (Ser/Thr protein kinase)
VISDHVSVEIACDSDLVVARAQARELADSLGFSRTDATLLATAVSEVARNIIVHAGSGSIEMTPLFGDSKHGLRIVAADSGPGIRDPQHALEEGYAGRGGFGLGLPGVKRLVDELERLRERRRQTES